MFSHFKKSLRNRPVSTSCYASGFRSFTRLRCSAKICNAISWKLTLWRQNRHQYRRNNNRRPYPCPCPSTLSQIKFIWFFGWNPQAWPRYFKLTKQYLRIKLFILRFYNQKHFEILIFIFIFELSWVRVLVVKSLGGRKTIAELFGAIRILPEGYYHRKANNIYKFT